MAQGQPKFRAAQVQEWLWTHLATSFDQMTNLPKDLRAVLTENAQVGVLTEVEKQVSVDGTAKWAFQDADGKKFETVMIPEDDRRTACISSQVGCAMGCAFCRTAQMGFLRNLTSGEILQQVAHVKRWLRETNQPNLSNIVFMGMGEPMANYNAVLAAVRAMTSPGPDGLGISARGVTVSTVGLVPRIRKLATEGVPVTLAVSLHAPDDELRDELCPINTRWKVGEVVDAAHSYFEATGRRVSIEYALIRDINDQGWRADALADVLWRGGHSWVHVNLIPLNPTPGSKWTASRRSDEDEFVRRLRARGVQVTVRDTRGREIDGACGQLAAVDRAT